MSPEPRDPIADALENVRRQLEDVRAQVARATGLAVYALVLGFGTFVLQILLVALFLSR